MRPSVTDAARRVCTVHAHPDARARTARRARP